jgi:hypothetical protein
MRCREIRWRHQKSNIKGKSGKALNMERPVASMVAVIAIAASTPTIDIISAAPLFIAVCHLLMRCSSIDPRIQKKRA